MNHSCDGCKKAIKEVGKLFKIGYMMLCKACRMNYKKGMMGLSINGRKMKSPKTMMELPI